MKTALIVIPTTGKPTLKRALKSVLEQTYPSVRCLVVIDGPDFSQPTNEIINSFYDKRIHTLHLPWNTGANGFYGHRILASVPALMNEDYFLPLDQDNWLDSYHVESMVTFCEQKNLQWCHSLRKVYDENENYICDDNCESLGRYPIYLSDNHHLVDTSTYCIRKEIIINLAPAWYSGWGGDRRFYSIISQHVPNFDCTGKHSVNYRLGGNPGSVTKEFFIQGNEVMRQKYPVGFPWVK